MQTCTALGPFLGLANRDVVLVGHVVRLRPHHRVLDLALSRNLGDPDVAHPLARAATIAAGVPNDLLPTAVVLAHGARHFDRHHLALAAGALTLLGVRHHHGVVALLGRKHRLEHRIDELARAGFVRRHRVLVRHLTRFGHHATRRVRRLALFVTPLANRDRAHFGHHLGHHDRAFVGCGCWRARLAAWRQSACVFAAAGAGAADGCDRFGTVWATTGTDPPHSICTVASSQLAACQPEVDRVAVEGDKVCLDLFLSGLVGPNTGQRRSSIDSTKTRQQTRAHDTPRRQEAK